MRREDPALRAAGKHRVEGMALSDDVLMLRFSPGRKETCLLVINLGAERTLASVSQPWAAPPEGQRWGTLWSSENPCYGGGGTYELDTPEGWRIPGEAAILLHPVSDE